LCAAATSWAQDAPAPPADPNQPQRIKERHYVRKFSIGATVGLSVLNQFSKTTETADIASNPPVHLIAEIDTRNDRGILGATIHFAFTNRMTFAVSPSYRKTAFHTFIQRFEGVNNPNTPIDERAFTRINEDTSARYFDIPLLVRRYNIEHTEPGKRWFYEGGVTYRAVRNVKTARETDPEPGDPVKDNVPLPHKNSVIGAVVGIGGQFVDDFGIRATPEVRYTYWLNRPFDSLNGRSRIHQIEILLTIGF
jgi:hypothetical protein